jgi:alpha-beta hydrolase superfamily lysophospholipase
VAHVEDIAGGQVVPVGHSFGGAALLSSVIAGKLPQTRRFVLSSPALRLKATVPGWKLALGKATSVLIPTLTLDNEVDPKTLSRIPEVADAYRTDPLVHGKISSRLYGEWGAACKAIFERAGEIRVPFLIIAGSDDRLIDPAGSEELHRRSEKVSMLRIFDGRYHEPFNDVDSEEVFGVIADWLSA